MDERKYIKHRYFHDLSHCLSKNGHIGAFKDKSGNIGMLGNQYGSFHDHFPFNPSKIQIRVIPYIDSMKLTLRLHPMYDCGDSLCSNPFQMVRCKRISVNREHTDLPTPTHQFVCPGNLYEAGGKKRNLDHG